MKAIKLLGITLITLNMMQCGATKFDNNPPFEIKNATYNNWIGGQRGVSGTRIMIEYTNSSEVVFDSIYFKNKIAKIELNTQENKMYLTGHFNTSSRDKNNLILDIDSKNEINNKPPPQEEKIPFELKQNEAVIRYQENGKIKYFKVENIQLVKSDLYQ